MVDEKNTKSEKCVATKDPAETHKKVHLGSRVMESEEKYRRKILVKLGDGMHCCSSYHCESRSKRPNSGADLSKYGGQGQSGL